jgi:hypothetical protein
VAEFFRQRLDPEALPPVIKAKWSPDLLTEGFVPFPKRVLRGLTAIFRDGKTGIERLAVILAVVDYKRPNLRRPANVDYLAFIAGIDAKRFKEVLSGLERDGWVSVRATNGDIHVDLDGFFDIVRKAAPEEG